MGSYCAGGLGLWTSQLDGMENLSPSASGGCRSIAEDRRGLDKKIEGDLFSVHKG